MENIPNKVSPNPLISSTVEIRFKSNVTKDQILGRVYQLFIKDFPNLSDRGLSRLSNTELPYIANYIFSNQLYGLMIDNDVIAFECLEEYPYWRNYKEIISENVNKLFCAIEIEKIERIGLRYINFFPNVNKVSDATILNINAPKQLFLNGRIDNLNMQYQIENYDINLQIQENVHLKKDNTKSGLLIDIDISQEQHIDKQNILSIIDILHQKEKVFFFELLSDSFKKNKITIEY